MGKSDDVAINRDQARSDGLKFLDQNIDHKQGPIEGSVRDKLRRSASQRAAMVEKFGCVPRSVLEIHRGALSKSLHLFQKERPERSATAQRRMTKVSKAKYLAHGALGGVMGGNVNTTRASTMPAEFVDFFVKYYSRPGEVYLDPFMGQGVQMQVAALRGLHYYGYDCCREFFAFVEAVAGRIKAETEVLITCGDSRYPTQIPEGIGDFCFTSPPYWDTEYYGEEEAQLGSDSSYEGFLSGMEVVARAWLPKFKPEAWIIINVNDFRRKGRFYPYHAHIIDLFVRAGYEPIDIWIVSGLATLARAFGVQKNLHRVAPKSHEYALVFRRPKK